MFFLQKLQVALPLSSTLKVGVCAEPGVNPALFTQGNRLAAIDKSRYTAPQTKGCVTLRRRKANPKNLIRIIPAEGWYFSLPYTRMILQSTLESFVDAAEIFPDYHRFICAIPICNCCIAGC